MGKKDHGRLVHELRAALIRHGFRPTGVTRLEDRGEDRTVRTPGFALQKHHDGKSVRLTHRPSRPPDPGGIDWAGWQSLGAARMKLLVRYHAALEREGFVCVEVCSRDPLEPYSLWRRA